MGFREKVLRGFSAVNWSLNSRASSRSNALGKKFQIGQAELHGDASHNSRGSNNETQMDKILEDRAIWTPRKEVYNYKAKLQELCELILVRNTNSLHRSLRAFIPYMEASMVSKVRNMKRLKISDARGGFIHDIAKDRWSNREIAIIFFCLANNDLSIAFRSLNHRNKRSILNKYHSLAGLYRAKVLHNPKVKPEDIFRKMFLHYLFLSQKDKNEIFEKSQFDISEISLIMDLYLIKKKRDFFFQKLGSMKGVNYNSSLIFDCADNYKHIFDDSYKAFKLLKVDTDTDWVPRDINHLRELVSRSLLSKNPIIRGHYPIKAPIKEDESSDVINVVPTDQNAEKTLEFAYKEAGNNPSIIVSIYKKDMNQGQVKLFLNLKELDKHIMKLKRNLLYEYESPGT